MMTIDVFVGLAATRQTNQRRFEGRVLRLVERCGRGETSTRVSSLAFVRSQCSRAYMAESRELERRRRRSGVRRGGVARQSYRLGVGGVRASNTPRVWVEVMGSASTECVPM